MVQKGQESIPGAGSYTVASRIDEGPKFSMGAKLDGVNQSAKKGVPGPGQYEMSNSPGKGAKTPSYTIGTGNRVDFANTKHSQHVPGPGNYAQDGLSHVKSAPKFGFGTSMRGNNAKKTEVPGPGNYSMKKLDDMPKFSMGVLTTYNPERKEAKHKPGPGNYSP